MREPESKRTTFRFGPIRSFMIRALAPARQGVGHRRLRRPLNSPQSGRDTGLGLIRSLKFFTSLSFAAVLIVVWSDSAGSSQPLGRCDRAPAKPRAVGDSVIILDGSPPPCVLSFVRSGPELHTDGERVFTIGRRVPRWPPQNPPAVAGSNSPT